MADDRSDPVPPFDLTRFRTSPLSGREHRVETERLARPVGVSDTAGAFLDSLPAYLGVLNLRALARAIVEAAGRDAPILWGLGGHVLKVGLGPLLRDLVDLGFATGFVMNGAAAIHDSEIALVGSTSEDVASGLFDGTYGSADDTGVFFANAARRAEQEGLGLGTSLARDLADRHPPQADASVLCLAAERNLPVTVHVAIGTDTVHMHPHCDGAALGAATHRDFLRLASIVERMDGGVYINVGSAVILPEVFMKAVAIVHNADPDRRVSITTGNLDMLRHYRPRVNVLERPAVKGYDISGHHEMTVPLLRLAILAAAAEATA